MAQEAKWIVTIDTRTGIANLSKFTEAQNHVTKSMDKTKASSKSLESGFSSLSKVLLRIGGAAGLGLIAKSFIHAASASEQFRLRMDTLLRSQSEGNRLFQEMSKLAVKIPYTYEEVLSVATRLTPIMRGGVDEISKWMPLVADLATVSGMTLEQTAGQFIRMYSAGANAAISFRRRGILNMLEFKTGVQYSVDETRKHLYKVWEDSTSKFRGVTNKLSTTWSGQLSMMEDKWFIFRNWLMDSGPFAAMKGGLLEVNRTLDTLMNNGKLQSFAERVGGKIYETVKVLALGTASIFDTIKPFMDFVVRQVGTIWANYQSLPPIVKEMGAVGILLFGWKGAAIVTAATTAIGYLDKIQNSEEHVSKELDLAWEAFNKYGERMKSLQEKLTKSAKGPEGEPFLTQSIEQVEQAMWLKLSFIQTLQEKLDRIKSGEKPSVLDNLLPDMKGKEFKDFSFFDIFKSDDAKDKDSARSKLEAIFKHIDDIIANRKNVPNDKPPLEEAVGLSDEQIEELKLKALALTGDLAAIRKLAEKKELEEATKWFEDKQESYIEEGMAEVNFDNYIAQAKDGIRKKQQDKEVKDRQKITDELHLASIEALGREKDIRRAEFAEKLNDVENTNKDTIDLMRELGYKEIEITEYIENKKAAIRRKYDEDEKKILVKSWTDKLNYFEQAFGKLGSFYKDYYNRQSDYQKNLQDALDNAQQAGDAKEAARLESKLAMSKKATLRAFKLEKAFRFSEAIINTASAVIKAYNELPFPANIAWAAAVGTIGAAQAGVILGEQPPSYKKGGISRGSTEGYLATLHGTEAVIPAPRGSVPLGINRTGELGIPLDQGFIPAEFKGVIGGQSIYGSGPSSKISKYGEGGVSYSPQLAYVGEQPEAHVPLKYMRSLASQAPAQQITQVTIQMNNPVFQDLETQRQVFATMAAEIARRVSPVAVVADYNNNGVVRRTIRQGQ